MLSIEVHHPGGLYADRLVAHFRGFGAEVAPYLLPRDLPLIVDEPEEHLPPEAGRADVVIAVNMHQDLLVALPGLLAARGGRALIVPLEDPNWARPGLVRQVTDQCRRRGLECEFPKPFCALVPQSPVIAQFARETRSGHPVIRFREVGGVVVEAECQRGAPCGLTAVAVEKMVGKGREEALGSAYGLQAVYPCLATMALDPALGDTIMHLSGGLLHDAVQDALKTADRD